MKRIGTTLAALGLCVAAAACQSPQQKIAAKEDMMTAAGFKFVPANTPQRQQAFKQLPAHRFSRQIRDGRVFYVYPDPTVCVCLYVGDQNAYAIISQEHVRQAARRRAADDRPGNGNEQLGLGSVGWLSDGLVLLGLGRRGRPIKQ